MQQCMFNPEAHPTAVMNTSPRIYHGEAISVKKHLLCMNGTADASGEGLTQKPQQRSQA
jgi:hypothetical protein